MTSWFKAFKGNSSWFRAKPIIGGLRPLIRGSSQILAGNFGLEPCSPNPKIVVRTLA